MAWSVHAWRRGGLEHGFDDRLAPQPAGVRTLRQVHGRRVLDLSALGDGGEPRPEADGIATDRVGTFVGIWTADCVPVLLVAPSARVAAAIHCGWRGIAAGIVPAALELLRSRWNVCPAEVEAALGPSIGGCCYEVGEEVREAFVARAGNELGSTGFEDRGGRLHLDLRSFLIAEMRAIGLRWTERVGPCTACTPDLLHSYRRERNTGRQLSYIGWRAAT
jgi:purine-nucleoside/S-methyl-5'-thioadenosine phosphorylase / adenosine deaminase